ncbi:MAG: Anomala cuprea entomopoxvirus, partial [Bacteroidota bacterium]
MAQNSNLDIVALIENNPITRLNTIYNKKFVERIRNSFCESEQQLFLASFYCYLNYDKEKDFIIELNKVWKWLGFSRIDHCKRVLEKYFINNIDYKITLPKLGERKNEGGYNKETILLNVKTFKKLCLKSNTKRADSIHDYFIRLEEVLQDILLEESKELQKELSQKQIELERTKKQLETKTKLAVKKWFDQEPGHTIYGYKSESQDLVTIGKSKNIKCRESDYLTHNPDGKMFYIRRCYNCDLAEKVLHHILDKYREERNREWFNISEELTIYTIDTVCDFLDSFINCSERLPEFGIKEFIETLPIERFNPHINLRDNSSIDHTKLSLVYNDNIKDYNKFVQDCCEIDDSKQSLTLTYDLRSAYKIWCKRALSPEIYNEFKEWINENFVIKEKYIETSGMRHKIVSNLKLKELQFIPNDLYNVESYEKFCLECCMVNYSHKMKISDFFINYIQWMQNQNPEYELSPNELTEIKNCLNEKLLVENGMVYGIQLKTDALPNFRLRTFNKINAVNENKEIIQTFNGISEAAELLNLEIKEVSDTIRYSRVIDMDNQKVLLVYDKGDTLIKTRAVHNDIIYLFDFHMKTLIRTFQSSIEAANYFQITKSTVLRYIAVEKVFSSKNEPGKQILLSYLDNIDDLIIRPKTKVVKPKRTKRLFAYLDGTSDLFREYAGPSDAAAQLKIGQCTVQRHIKSGNPLCIIDNDNKISIIFTYN